MAESPYQSKAISKPVESVSSAPDKSRRDKEQMLVQEGEGRCRSCKRFIGIVVHNRNLQIGEAVLVTTTPVRCRSCNERNVWTPLRP